MTIPPSCHAIVFTLRLLAVVLFAAPAFTPPARAAAPGAPIWTNSFYDVTGAAMAVDGNGNVFVTGYSYSSGYATVAYSGAGIPLWTNSYNGPTSNADRALALAVDHNGNVFVTGYSWVSSGGGFGDTDYATIGYSGTGVPLWTNRYGGTGNGGQSIARAIAVDGNGNVFVTGSSAGSCATIKYSGAGVPLWTNRYDDPGFGAAAANALAVDGSGNVFITGTAQHDYLTVAYSGAGAPLWTSRYNGPENNDDSATAIAVDGSGNVFVTGVTYTGCGTVAYSGAGVPLWTNWSEYGGATSVAVDKNGSVLVAGISYDSRGANLDYATTKYSGAGVPLWTNRYDGPGINTDYANAVAVDKIGNVFVTGYSSGTNVYPDYATVAYSGAGVPLWTNRYAGPLNGIDQAQAMAVDGSGNVFVTGFSDASQGCVTIKYATLVPPPLVLTQTAVANGLFQFQFNAHSNLTYAVEFCDFLNSGNWATMTNISAQPSPTVITVTNAITNTARFYRVRTP